MADLFRLTLPGDDHLPGRVRVRSPEFSSSRRHTMTEQHTTYFDLHTQGLGYLHRAREVTP
ncbi:MAG: DUF3577 domain-containing protein, partial [Gammaproteobacteria bacterium]